MCFGLAENIIPEPWKRQSSGAGFSKLAIARSASESSSRTMPALPVFFV